MFCAVAGGQSKAPLKTSLDKGGKFKNLTMEFKAQLRRLVKKKAPKMRGLFKVYRSLVLHPAPNAAFRQIKQQCQDH